MRVYIRSAVNREWFQASVAMNKDFITEIDSLTPYQKQRYLNKKDKSWPNGKKGRILKETFVKS